MIKDNFTMKKVYKIDITIHLVLIYLIGFPMVLKGEY